MVENHLARSLARLGHSVDLITRRSDPAQPDAVELEPGVTLRHLPGGPAKRLAKSAIDAHIPEFAAALSRLDPYDIVHSHHWMSGVAALPSARAWGAPHVQSYHSVAALPGSPLSDGEPPESPARVAGEREVAIASQAVVAISAAEARTVVERLRADPDRVCIVAPGVDPEVFRHDGETWALPAGVHAPNGYVLFAARLQPLKGPDLAIAAMAGLAPERRPHLVLAGDVSEDFAAYERELHNMVTELGLAGQVTFVGPQSRAGLAAMMRGARLVLVPSHSETFGLVALEAASCGTPVIASAAGGLREAVVHGESGQLMDSRRPEDWANAMSRLLTQPHLLEMQGVVARIHARRFDWDWSARHLQAIYGSLLTRLPA